MRVGSKTVSKILCIISMNKITTCLHKGGNAILMIPFVMLLLTVFVISNELANGIVSGKYFWFYISLGLAAPAAFISFVINRRNVRLNLLDLLVLVFSIITLSVSYYHNQSANNKFVLLGLLTVLYFCFRLFFTQYRPNLYFLTLFFIFTGLVEAVWGLQQLYGISVSQHGLFKTTGSFFNPGPYAGYLSVVFPCAFYYLLNDYRCFKRKFHRYYLPFYFRWVLSGLTVVGIFLVLPATWSRASWIAVSISCLFISLCFITKQRNTKRKLLAYYNCHKKRVLLFFLLCALAISAGLGGIYMLKKDSADGRVLMWKTSVQVIKSYPFGVGLGNFSGSYGDKQAAYFASEMPSEREKLVAGNPEYAFNEYLQIATESGIVSLFVFLFLIGYTIYTGTKRGMHAQSGSFIAMLVFASASYPFSVLPFLIVLVFLIASCVTDNKNNQERCSNGKLAALSCVAILSVFLVAATFYNRSKQYEAYKKWNTTKILYSVGMYADVAVEYEQIYPYLTHEIQFLFEYAQALSRSEQYDRSNKVLQKAGRISCDPMLYNIMGKNYQALGKYQSAESCFVKAANTVPNRLYPYYLLGKLYHEMGLQKKVCEMTTYIHTKEAKVHSKAVEEMREEMKQLCEQTDEK